MAYTSPLGSAANFATATIDFPRPYNGLVFKQLAGGYVAPLGGVVLAVFSAEYEPPLGSAANFVEAYSGPTTVSIRAGATNRWVGASRKANAISSAHPATKVDDQQKAAPWGTAQKADVTDGSAWRVSTRTDAASDLPYGEFGEMLTEVFRSGWVMPKATDDQCHAAWSMFGEMLNEERDSKYRGSKPIDHMKRSGWQGHLIQSRRIVPVPRPLGNAVNFNVFGGGITSLGTGGAYVPPLGNAIHFTFPNGAYSAPWMVGSDVSQYEAPNGRAANFLYAPAYELLLDGTGNPVVDISTRDTHAVVPWGLSTHADRDTTHPWTKYSRPLNPGWGIVVPAGPPTPVDGETITIPIQRVYIVINEIQLLRVSDMSPIPALNLNIGFDCDSWLPTFSATIPEAARDAVMPDPGPVEIEATINGSQFRFFVERIARSRAFAQRSVTISGRGVACELDAPYAAQAQHTNTIDRTAQQIIDAALGFSGYTQTWNITDWLVPANTYSLFGTAAQVAADVAEASGSVLAADWSLRDLRMLPRYPVKPWEWAGATPDYVIPGAVTQTESLEWIEKPSYNVVYVSGAQNGVLGQVKLTGTAGDLSAPMVTHPLITHADAARQRGIAVLGDTGRKAMLQISMPVLESTGVIDVCKLIEFNDGAVARRGIVRANSISVNWPAVRQTLTIEAAA